MTKQRGIVSILITSMLGICFWQSKVAAVLFFWIASGPNWESPKMTFFEFQRGGLRAASLVLIWARAFRSAANFVHLRYAVA